jgi:hypothetical protein
MSVLGNESVFDEGDKDVVEVVVLQMLVTWELQKCFE